ncbi:UbiA prenyltransferase family protein [Salisaeta longa]|uniref:hypothetical protein n=1 Tax=Salisaeta longa TaxID=503170 RepID=UPI0003B2FC5B|nr:hypothetical protein [Salisaeta longa]
MAVTRPSTFSPAQATGASRVLQWAAHDPLLMGLVAVALLLGTSAWLGVAPSGPLLVMGGAGTTLVYLADRVLGFAAEDVYNRPRRVRWVTRHRRYLWLETAVASALVGGTVALVRPETLVAAGGVAVAGVVHVVPLVPRAGRLKARWSAGKTGLVVFTWAAAAVVLPVVEATGTLSVDALALGAYRVAFLLPNVIVADWLDRAGDASAGLRPWAAQWTPRRVMYSSGGSVMVGLALLAVLRPPLPVVVAEGGVLLLMGAMARRACQRRGGPYAMLWLDVLVAGPALGYLLLQL